MHFRIDLEATGQSAVFRCENEEYFCGQLQLWHNSCVHGRAYGLKLHRAAAAVLEGPPVTSPEEERFTDRSVVVDLLDLRRGSRAVYRRQSLMESEFGVGLILCINNRSSSTNTHVKKIPALDTSWPLHTHALTAAGSTDHWDLVYFA